MPFHFSLGKDKAGVEMGEGGGGAKHSFNSLKGSPALFDT